MQIKTIKKVITTKLEEWLASITDAKLREDVKNNLLVSGGSIASLFLNDPVNDYDIYLQDIDVLLRLTNYYVLPLVPEYGATVWDGAKKVELIEEYRSVRGGDYLTQDNYWASTLRNLEANQVKIFVDGGGVKIENALQNASETEIPKKYQVSFLSPNAISLTDDIQIVIRFHGTPEEIHKTFDFIHATNYFTFKDGIVTNIKALESLIAKQLYYQGSLYPLTSVIRAKKFIKRNWNISAGEYLKMMFQISTLDLQNIDILEEQLIGVDVAYFSVLISALRSHNSSNPQFKLSAEYLNSLIDRISNDEE
jgi:hypothetical protein